MAKHLVIVIFGATGDLTHRKLIPSLFRLYLNKNLPAEFSIIGFARREKSDRDFRNELYESLKKHSKIKDGKSEWEKFSANIKYHKSDFNEDEGYFLLREKLDKIKNKNVLFYLATLSSHFEPVVSMLEKHKLNEKSKGEWTRVIIEKPFGEDLKSAISLNKKLREHFSENEIFRIDHYLGKELVQNILVLRFTNLIFEQLWNSKYIDNVQIIVSEDMGIEDRGLFYENTGALKDMVQNHVLQLISLVAMEPPASLDPDDNRDEKLKVLRCLSLTTENNPKPNVVIGQYSTGKGMKAYREELNVDKNSNTETFAAMKIYVNNIRWAEVPFYIKTGKRLSRKEAFIAVEFKNLPCLLFCQVPGSEMHPNRLIIKIQPEEGVQFDFNMKKPGNTYQVRNVKMDFCHDCTFGPNSPEAYERLIYDIIQGDSTLFSRSDEVENAWNIIEEIKRHLKTKKVKLPNYEAGSEGPQESVEMIKKDRRNWVKI